MATSQGDGENKEEAGAPPSGASSRVSSDGNSDGGGDKEVKEKRYGDVVDISKNRRLPFPWKVYQLLQDVEKENDQHIISWMPSGRSFKVHQREAFVSNIMPVYFQQKSYKSFQRQLYIYGFDRISSGVVGAERGAYFHPQFVKGNQELTLEIQKVSKQCGGAGGSVGATINSNSRHRQHSSLPSSASTARLQMGFESAAYLQQQHHEQQQQQQQHPIAAASFPMREHQQQHHSGTAGSSSISDGPLWQQQARTNFPSHLLHQRRQPQLLLQAPPPPNAMHEVYTMTSDSQQLPSYQQRSQSSDIMELSRRFGRYQQQQQQQQAAYHPDQEDGRGPDYNMGSINLSESRGGDAGRAAAVGVQEMMGLPTGEQVVNQQAFRTSSMPPADATVLGALWSLTSPSVNLPRETALQQHLSGDQGLTTHSFGVQQRLPSSSEYPPDTSTPLQSHQQYHHSPIESRSAVASASALTNDPSFISHLHQQQNESRRTMDRNNPPAADSSALAHLHHQYPRSSAHHHNRGQSTLSAPSSSLIQEQLQLMQQQLLKTASEAAPASQQGDHHHRHHDRATAPSSTDEAAAAAAAAGGGVLLGAAANDSAVTRNSFSSSSEDDSAGPPIQDWFSSIERHFRKRGS